MNKQPRRKRRPREKNPRSLCLLLPSLSLSVVFGTLFSLFLSCWCVTYSYATPIHQSNSSQHPFAPGVYVRLAPSLSIALPRAFVSMSVYVCVPLFLSLSLSVFFCQWLSTPNAHRSCNSPCLTRSLKSTYRLLFLRLSVCMCVSERKNINLSTCVELKRVHKNNRQVKHASVHTIVCMWLVY